MDHARHMEDNRRNWDDRAGLHARPATGYRLDRYRDDPALLSDVVDFDRRYLGDLTDLTDLVYTGVGSINWLPDIARWGGVVGELVAPGGSFYIRKCHPTAYAIDDGDDVPAGTLRLKYPYFETGEPMTFDDPDTYVDTAGEQLRHSTSHEWNHGLGEVFMALVNAGLHVTTLDEHRFLEWKMLPGQVERDERFHLPDHQLDMVPMMYSMVANRPGGEPTR